jgi:hypothetical protein
MLTASIDFKAMSIIRHKERVKKGAYGRNIKYSCMKMEK